MLEDAVLSLNHRSETFVTARTRYDDIPKLQFEADWSVRNACWEMLEAPSSKYPENLAPAIRPFLPSPPKRPLVGREDEVASVLRRLKGSPEPCPRVGLLGATGSG